METLPDEVLALILAHAEPLVLWKGRLKLVCARWRHVLDTTPALARRAHSARLAAYDKRWIGPREILVPGARELKGLTGGYGDHTVKGMAAVRGAKYLFVAAHVNHAYFPPHATAVLRRWSLETKRYQGKPITVPGHRLVAATQSVILTSAGHWVYLSTSDGTPILKWHTQSRDPAVTISGDHMYFVGDAGIMAMSLRDLTFHTKIDYALPKTAVMLPNDDRGGGVRVLGSKYTYYWTSLDAPLIRKPRHFSDKYYHLRETDHWISQGKLYW